MAEALYNASGPRAADRDDASPTARSARRSTSGTTTPTRCRSATRGWIQLYAESNQEAVDLHIQAFRLAEELSLPVMVCMDGFILTHAFEPVDVPGAGGGRRLPAAVRAAPAARPGRAGDDRRDGRARGVHRGALPRAREADAGARPRSRELAAEFAAGVRPRLGRPRAPLPHRGRGDGRRRARVGARHDRGRRRRAARRGRCASARSASLLPPVPARRGPRGARRRRPGRRGREGASRSASAGSSGRTSGSRSPGCRRTSTTSSPGSGAAPITRRSLRGLIDDVRADRAEPLTSSTWTGSWSSGSCSDCRRRAAPGRTRRTSSATSASSRRRSH